jgi:CcmD family protein
VICYNARVTVRSLVVAMCLVLPAPAFAAAAASTSGAVTMTTSGAMVQTTAGGAAVPGSGMKPGVAKTPASKHPYFFAAYAVVWAVLFGYALWLGSRIRALEQKVASATNRSR